MEIDVVCFEDAVAGKRRSAAVAEYGGDLLAGIDDEWLSSERERLRERFVRAALEVADQAQRDSDPKAVESIARRLLAIDPWSEDAIRRLMSAR